MEKHPVREQVVREMHLRRWPLLEVPSVVHQWVTIVEPEDRNSECAHLMQYAFPVEGDPPHRSGNITSDIAFTWERHSEGSSLALFSRIAEGDTAEKLSKAPDVDAALHWVSQLPGKILRATRVFITKDDRAADRLLPLLNFNRPELVSCHIQGSARLWSDFRLRDDDFGCLLVAANELDPRDLTRSIQRLQELGNYRNKALMGLPVAQSLWPSLNATEASLAQLAKRLSDGKERDDDLMVELSRLSIELVAIATQSGYRMGATAAYAGLVVERLEQLDISAHPRFRLAYRLHGTPVPAGGANMRGAAGPRTAAFRPRHQAFLAVAGED